MGTLLVQRLGIIVRDASSTILRQQAWVNISERVILTHLAKDKIILFTTHRYDTIRRADSIVVLVDGQVAEVGAADVLERKAGAFWSLYFGQGAQLQPAAH